MAQTKGFYVRQALRKIGIRADEYAIDSDEMRDGLCELESLVLNLEGRGIRFPYALAVDQENIDPSQDSNLPDYVGDALIYQLAVRLCSDYGKAVSPDLRKQANASLNTLYMSLDVPEIEYGRNMPRGSGNNQRFQHYYRYYNQSSDILVENALELKTGNGRRLPSDKLDSQTGKASQSFEGGNAGPGNGGTGDNGNPTPGNEDSHNPGGGGGTPPEPPTREDFTVTALPDLGWPDRAIPDNVTPDIVPA